MGLENTVQKLLANYYNIHHILFGQKNKQPDIPTLINGQIYKKATIQIIDVAALENELSNLKMEVEWLDEQLNKEIEKRRLAEQLNVNLMNEIHTNHYAAEKNHLSELKAMNRNAKLLQYEKDAHFLKGQNQELNKKLNIEIFTRKRLESLNDRLYNELKDKKQSQGVSIEDNNAKEALMPHTITTEMNNSELRKLLRKEVAKRCSMQQQYNELRDEFLKIKNIQMG